MEQNLMIAGWIIIVEHQQHAKRHARLLAEEWHQRPEAVPDPLIEEAGSSRCQRHANRATPLARFALDVLAVNSIMPHIFDDSKIGVRIGVHCGPVIEAAAAVNKRGGADVGGAAASWEELGAYPLWLSEESTKRTVLAAIRRSMRKRLRVL